MDDSNCDPREHRLRWLTGYPAAVIVLIGFAWLADSSTAQKCSTFDEIAHLTAGYSYWAIRDYRLNSENGMLPQRWAALPHYIKGYNFPARDDVDWHEANAFPIGNHFFYEEGNDVNQMLLMGRRMTIVLGVLFGLLIYGWSRRLFGRAGGMVSLLLFALSPNILAHSRLITSDVPIALAFTAAAAAAWWMFHRISVVSVAAAALAMAWLFLTKMSAVLFGPMLVLLIVLRMINGQPLPIENGERSLKKRIPVLLTLIGALGLCAAVTCLAIWSFHEFRYASSISDPMLFDWAGLQRVPPFIQAAVDGARQWQLLPEPYLYGFTYVIDKSARREAYLLGQAGSDGWWYYFPVCMLLKTPLGTFGIIAAAAAAGLSTARGARFKHPTRAFAARLYHFAPLLVVLGVYWAFALRSHLNIGYRHVLPTFGPMFILVGAAGAWFDSSRRVGRLIVMGCLIVLAVESWSIRPHYLAFFNALGGGPQRSYRYLVDSNNDWGQDLPGLKKWIDEDRLQNGRSDIYLAYFGTGQAAYYGIEPLFLPGYGHGGYLPGKRIELGAGIYCVSVTILPSCMIQDLTLRVPWNAQLEARWQGFDRDELARYHNSVGDRNAIKALIAEKGIDYWVHLLVDHDLLRQARLCSYLRQRRPDAHVGYSILIYRLTDADIDAAMNGPLPEMTQGRKKLMFTERQTAP